MSTDQPELSAFNAEDSESKPSRTASAPALDHAPENECLNCGADVEPQTARVLGDNNGNIPACAEPECRKDVIDDASLASNSYQVTARVVRAVRSREQGVTTDPTAGGRR